jgi:hypothetical protein
MGWKLSSIIVNPVTNFNPEDLLNKLGFNNLVKGKFHFLQNEPL